MVVSILVPESFVAILKLSTKLKKKQKSSQSLEDCLHKYFSQWTQCVHPVSPYRREHTVIALTDVVSVMQCVAVRQAGYSQVSLSAQTVQHILDKVLALGQGQEHLHVVCHTHE